MTIITTILSIAVTFLLGLATVTVTLLAARGNNRTTAQGQAIDGLDKLAEGRNEEIDRLQRRVHDLEREVAAKEAEILGLRDSNIKLQAQMFGLITENAALKSAIENANTRINALEVQMKAMAESPAPRRRAAPKPKES